MRMHSQVPGSVWVSGTQTCGNGIIEGTEECDCGSTTDCGTFDPCCVASTCKLKAGATCSALAACCNNPNNP